MTMKLSTRRYLLQPLQSRQSSDLVAGTELTASDGGADTGAGILWRTERRLAAARVEDVAGCLGYAGEAKSLAEMDEAIAGMVEERSRRGRY
jgi:hypothetical protein